MTQQKLPQTLLALTLAAFAAAAFLLPPGTFLPHLAYWATLVLVAGALSAFAYARTQAAPATLRREELRPRIERHTAVGEYVPASLLAGSSPLVAITAQGQVPHPELEALLAPYFAEPTLAFVQGAVRYDGAGGVADAFRLSASLDAQAQQARESLNAVELRGTAAILSREALREAWRPGDTWASLGMRLQALGYTGRFEPRPMALAWAPLTVSDYGAELVRRTRTAISMAARALRTGNLPLEARLQYLAAAAAPLGAWAAAATFALGAFSLVLFDVGPVIVSSPAAWLGDALAILCAAGAAAVLRRLTGVNPARPMALALAGVYTFVGETAYAAATSPQAKRAWGVATNTVRTAYAIARGGGSADTAPAGSPARS